MLHIPVLLNEVLEYMKPAPGKNYIDTTGGAGGMSAALLDGSSPDGRVLTIDTDPRAIEILRDRLSGYGNRSVLVRDNFRNVLKVATREGFTGSDGILFDLGVSSMMLDRSGYGMSIRLDGPLDMRFDPELERSAEDIVNDATESELAEMFREMDEGRFARRIASAIVRARNESRITSTEQLAGIVSNAIPRRFHPRGMHPATRAFLALRVAVNMERETLREALDGAPEVLKTGGVMCVLCWSSFEDRIVKSATRERRDVWEKVARKPVTPGEDEIRRNPRSRSARMRVFRMIA